MELTPRFERVDYSCRRVRREYCRHYKTSVARGEVSVEASSNSADSAVSSLAAVLSGG